MARAKWLPANIHTQTQINTNARGTQTPQNECSRTCYSFRRAKRANKKKKKLENRKKIHENDCFFTKVFQTHLCVTSFSVIPFHSFHEVKHTHTASRFHFFFLLFASQSLSFFCMRIRFCCSTMASANAYCRPVPVCGHQKLVRTKLSPATTHH